MNKKMNFDLTIATNALLCPNPSEWYAKAYITQEIADNFRVIPGVKASTKVSTATFPSVLKAETCDFTASVNALSATTVSVCPIQAQVQICKKDLESSYVSMEMAKGSANWSVAGFMMNYWDNLSGEIQSEIASIMWVGNTAGTGTTYSGDNAYRTLCDGFEKLLGADAAVVDVTLTASTVANVIDNITALLAGAPAAVLATRKSDLRIYVASDVFTKFQIAASKGNTISYVTELLGANFAGIRIVECPGMSTGKMVLSRVSNLVYALDGESDSTDLKAIDLTETTGQPLLRTAVYLKVGFAILNPSEIVFFN